MTRASKLILMFLAVLLIAVAGVALDQRHENPQSAAPPASTSSPTNNPASGSPASPANDPFGGLK